MLLRVSEGVSYKTLPLADARRSDACKTLLGWKNEMMLRLEAKAKVTHLRLQGG